MDANQAVQVCGKCANETQFGRFYQGDLGAETEPFFFCHRCVLTVRYSKKIVHYMTILIAETICLGLLVVLMAYAFNWNFWVILCGALLVLAVDAYLIFRIRQATRIITAIVANNTAQMEQMITDKSVEQAGKSIANEIVALHLTKREEKRKEERAEQTRIAARTQTSRQFIEAMVAKCETMQIMSGNSSEMIILSPGEAWNFERLASLKSAPEYLEYDDVRLAKNAQILHPHIVFNRGNCIYHSGVVFPDHCVACMIPTEKHILVETRLSVGGSNRLFIEDDPERKQRIERAYYYARYWLALPFCEEHGINDKAIRMEVSDSGGSKPLTLRISFTNIEYGQLFGAANEGLREKFAVSSPCGDILFNNPAEKAEMDARDADWQNRLVQRRKRWRKINWLTLPGVAAILIALDAPTFSNIKSIHEAGFFAWIGTAFMTIPWFVINAHIKRKGNYPFGKKGIST